MASHNIQDYSLEQWTKYADTYPKNTKATLKSDHALHAYSNRLSTDKDYLFGKNREHQIVWLWNMSQDQEARRLPDLIELKDALSSPMGSKESKFIFLQTASSRGALCCTREQFLSVLSCFEVMPGFLDLCFKLGGMRKPSIANHFRLDDLFLPNHVSSRGTRVQHSFDFLAFEKKVERSLLGRSSDAQDSEEQAITWSLRRTTVYHSYDVHQQNAVWIIIKGNGSIRKRVTGKPEPHNAINGNRTKTKQEDVFLSTLMTHLQIIESCTESWEEHYDYLSKEAENVDLIYFPVDEIAEESARRMEHKEPVVPRPLRYMPKPLRRESTMSIIKPIQRGMSSLSGRLFRRATQSRPNAEPAELTEVVATPNTFPGDDDTELEDPFKFVSLQRTHELTEALQNLILVIEQNAAIITELSKRYVRLSETPHFDSVQIHITQFIQQLEIISNDLKSNLSRVKDLSHKVERREELIKTSIEYQNMKLGEFFARSAQSVAQKTKEETTSMHIITFLTMIFLPGTFISTLFSSQVIIFDPHPRSGNLGDWTVNWPALKLFLLLCFPVMLLTSLCWWFFYTRSKKKKGPVGSK